MNVATLDERLREQARSTLSAQAKAATEPVYLLLNHSVKLVSVKVAKSRVQEVEGSDKLDIRLTPGQLLHALQSAIYDANIEKREEAALRKFIDDVENLRANVDDLYAITDDLEGRQQ